jgi:hypothetical protein
MRVFITVLILGLAGCSTEPVACDAHLTPINAVAKPSPDWGNKPDAAARLGAPAQPAAGKRQGSGR